MVSHQRAERRSFLVSALAMAGVGTLPWSRSGTTAEPAAQLLALFRTPEAAVEVGRRYLAGRGTGDSTAGLVARLERDAEIMAALQDHHRERLRAAIGRRIDADLAAARVARIDGWIVATTEAEVCAVCALGAAGHT